MTTRASTRSGVASDISPIGMSVREHIRQLLRDDPAYRAEYERLEPYERIARQVMWRRAELGLTQRELAERMGTSHSVISRIENGQHATSVKTLHRLAAALDTDLVIDFSKKRTRPGPRKAAA